MNDSIAGSSDAVFIICHIVIRPQMLYCFLDTQMWLTMVGQRKDSDILNNALTCTP